MSEDVMLSGRVPKELKDLVDADSRDNQEVLRAALWREFGGERQSDLKRQKSEKVRRRRSLLNEVSEREDDIEKLDKQIQALDSKLNEEQMEREAEVEQTLEQLDSVPWEPDNPAIQTNADDLDMEPSELIDRLEDYHAE